MFAVNTGVCQDVMRRSNIGQVCDVSFDDNACVDGYVCLGANGRRIGNLGIGICTLRSTIEVVNDYVVIDDVGGNENGQWYVDYSLGAQGQCVQSCNENRGGYCGGVNKEWEEDELWTTAEECCTQKLWWMELDQCVSNYYGWRS